MSYFSGYLALVPSSTLVLCQQSGAGCSRGTFALALLAAELGFLEKLTFLQAGGLGRYSSEALLVNFTALLVVLLGASVVLYVTAPMHNEHTHAYSAVHKP